MSDGRGVPDECSGVLFTVVLEPVPFTKVARVLGEHPDCTGYYTSHIPATVLATIL